MPAAPSLRRPWAAKGAARATLRGGPHLWLTGAILVVVLGSGCLQAGSATTGTEPPAVERLELVAASGASQVVTPPWPAGVHEYTIEVAGEPAHGLVAVPEGEPTTLVVVAHGWGGDAAGHRGDLETLAEAGAVAVAMDYRGPQSAFKVRAGVEDTVAATLDLQARFPHIDRTLVYGWSMGGEVAMLALAHAPAGTYDYAFVGAGVSDLEAFWHEAVFARPEIEREAGGPPLQSQWAYRQRSPVERVGEIVGQGVQRVFLLHGAADGVVPLDHAERLAEALQGGGIPTSYYVVTRDRWTACLPVGCAQAAAPADHYAGRMAPMLPFILHRIERAPDPTEPFLRGTYDADAGTYDPSDTGP